MSVRATLQQYRVAVCNLGSELEHGSAARSFKTVEVSALLGGAVEIARSVHDQGPMWKCPVRLTGEAIQQGFVAIPVQPEH